MICFIVTLHSSDIQFIYVLTDQCSSCDVNIPCADFCIPSYMQKVTRFDVLSELWKGVTSDRLVLSKITVPLCLLLKGRHEKESMSVS